MAVRASNQTTLIDLTDAYSVQMTNEAHIFIGDTDSVSTTQTTTTQILALCGAEIISCSVGEITCPTGLSAVSDGKTPSPTITITATSALTTSGTITIPVIIGDITINKVFSYSIAFKGATGTGVKITSKAVEYQKSSNGTTAPTGTWATSIPALAAGEYLWTRTTVKYSDGNSTISYSVSRNGTNGSNGSSVTVTSTKTEYQKGSSGTTTPTGTWVTTVPSTGAGEYLWTRTTTTYSDGKKAISYSVSRNGTNGTNGTDGADAITLVVESSNGTIFKNTEIATTLTARIYKAGVEVTGTALSALGTVKWYKDNGTTPVATGSTLTVKAGDVSNKASYTAKLEG